MLEKFNSTQMQREANLVFEAAKNGPVEIRRQSDIDYVLITREQYDLLKRMAV